MCKTTSSFFYLAFSRQGQGRPRLRGGGAGDLKTQGLD
jgi:hypothetical protein